MDPRDNPYTPNAGARPPVLVGREDQLASFDVLLARLERGHTEQSMVITGLRGVGKTVLLGAFREASEERGWAAVEIEVAKHDDDAFRRVLAREVRRALLGIAPRDRWMDRARRAAGVLRSFTLSVDPEGTLSVGLGEPEVGQADSGMLDADLTDVFVAIGEAARDHETGVVLLLDEIQFLASGQLEAVLAALHRTVQRSLPVTVVAAGLPQLPELAGEAKSYAERLLKFPAIGRLDPATARRALVEPANALGVDYDDDAAAEVVHYTQGYPYFLQEYGKAVWDLAPGSPIALEIVAEAQKAVEDKLDSSFFRVRIDRTTELELAYLRAMAELGPDPQAAGDVAAVLHRTSQQVGPTRARLIDKGLLYTPRYGYAAFTVPQFDRFMKRHHPLVVPERRAGRRRT